MSTVRGITISPPPQPVGVTLTTHYWNLKRWIMRTLNRSCGYYILYPEITETGRLHFHGTVHIKNMVKWKRETSQWLRKIGFIKLENFYTNGIQGQMRWIMYCRKEFHQTQLVLDIDRPILYDKPPKKKAVPVDDALDQNMFNKWVLT